MIKKSNSLSLRYLIEKNKEEILKDTKKLEQIEQQVEKKYTNK